MYVHREGGKIIWHSRMKPSVCRRAPALDICITIERGILLNQGVQETDLEHWPWTLGSGDDSNTCQNWLGIRSAAWHKSLVDYRNKTTRRPRHHSGIFHQSQTALAWTPLWASCWNSSGASAQPLISHLLGVIWVSKLIAVSGNLKNVRIIS